MNYLEIYNSSYQKLGILNDDTLLSANNINEKHSINEISEITFDIPLQSTKWQYVVNENLVKWKNEFYIIKNTNYAHSSDGKKITVRCLHLAYNLGTIYCPAFDLIGKSAYELMTEVLKNTGWSVGAVDIQDKYRALQTDEQTVFSNLSKIAELFYGMLKFNSIAKTVDLTTVFPNRGVVVQKGVNLKSVNLTYDTSELVTRIYPFGGNDPITGNEINIISVNPTSQSYIEDYTWYMTKDGVTLEEAQANIEYKHELIWRNGDYLDAQQLYDDALKKMEIVSKPKISCNVDMLDLSSYPQYFAQTPIIGEIITVMDDDLGLTLEAQVVSYSCNSNSPIAIQVGISNAIEIESIMKEIKDTSSRLDKILTSKNGVKTSYLEGLINVLRTRLNSAQSHWYTDESGNIVLESVDGASCMKLGGGIFALADSKLPDGSWNWRSFGTGKGFSADEINTGVLRGDGWYQNLSSLPYDVKDLDGNVLFTLPAGSILIGNSPTDYILYFDGTSLKIKLIDGLQSEISSKVSTNDFESYKIQTAEQIAQKVGSDNIASLIEQNPDSVKIAVGQIGGNNIVKNGGFVFGISQFTTSGATVSTVDASWATSGKAAIVQCTSNKMSLSYRVLPKLKNGVKYTISFTVVMSYVTSLGSMSGFLYDRSTGYIISGITCPYGREYKQITRTEYGDNIVPCKFTFVADGTVDYGLKWQQSTTDATDFYISDIKVEEGENVTAWSPHSSEANGTYYKFDGSGFEISNENNKLILSPKGIAQCDNITVNDNVDVNNPLVIRFNIDDNTNQGGIDSVLLKISSQKFRAYSKGAKSGGGTKTSASGGSSTPTTSTKTSASYTSESQHWNNGQGSTVSVFYDVTEDVHYLSLNLISHDHSITIPSHSHTVSIAGHTHTIDTTHSHDIDYGIYQQESVANSMSIVIDGTTRITGLTGESVQNLTQWITTNGWHTVEITSSQNGRISANLYTKTYVQY